jgi:hypothetical protein
MQQENKTASEFVKMWPTLSKRKINKWKLLHKGGCPIHSKKGRPNLLDEEGKAEFDDGHDNTRDLRTLKKLFNKCASDTAIRSEENNPGEFAVPSVSCFEKYHKSCNSKAVLPQITTVARDREEKDPRIFLLGLFYFLPIVYFCQRLWYSTGMLLLSHVVTMR